MNSLGEESQDRPDWSVVVITRNEEMIIGKCLDSVVQAFSGRSFELILVDSASTDRTVEIAKGYPARIICLKATDPLRPSVGRNVGLQLARAERVVFLDGDSILNPEWVGPAAEALRSDPLLAGVAGEMEHVFEARGEDRIAYRHAYPDTDYVEATHLGGSALYRRQPLEQVGGFNPFLRAYEEAELGARMRKAGFRLRRLRTLMTQHCLKSRIDTRSRDQYCRRSLASPQAWLLFRHGAVPALCHRLQLASSKTVQRRVTTLAFLPVGNRWFRCIGHWADNWKVGSATELGDLYGPALSRVRHSCP